MLIGFFLSDFTFPITTFKETIFSDDTLYIYLKFNTFRIQVSLILNSYSCRNDYTLWTFNFITLFLPSQPNLALSYNERSTYIFPFQTNRRRISNHTKNLHLLQLQARKVTLLVLKVFHHSTDLPVEANHNHKTGILLSENSTQFPDSSRTSPIGQTFLYKSNTFSSE